MSQQFCLKWNNHMSNMMDVFKNLLSTEAMVDVTLACDGLSLKAHKIVLSACSPFFQSLFLENPCKHPIVILKDMKYTELKAIIEFMYHGEVNVAQDQLSALMKTAETLRVKGLAEVTNEKNQSGDESSHRSVSRTDTPPPKRRRGRTRKRSMSDQSDDGASEPKIKQPDSDIEELSGDMDPSTPYSTASTVPLQSHSTNSFHKSQQEQQPVEQGADESFAAEEKFAVEPSKLLEQTLTTDDLPRRSGRSSVQSNMELQRRPRSSTDHSSSIVPVTSTPMSSDALVVANQQPESPPDIKPELLDLEPPMSPVAGPSHSADENSMMMYMDQSSMSNMPGPSGYQDNSALVSTDSQPQAKKTAELESKILKKISKNPELTMENSEKSSSKPTATQKPADDDIAIVEMTFAVKSEPDLEEMETEPSSLIVPNLQDSAASMKNFFLDCLVSSPKSSGPQASQVPESNEEISKLQESLDGKQNELEFAYERIKYLEEELRKTRPDPVLVQEAAEDMAIHALKETFTRMLENKEKKLIIKKPSNENKNVKETCAKAAENKEKKIIKKPAIEIKHVQETDGGNISILSTQSVTEFSEYHHVIPKPKTKSPVWIYFGLPADEEGRVVNTNVAICTICYKMVSSKGGSTTNLSSHLKCHHPSKYRSMRAASNICNTADIDNVQADTEYEINENTRTQQNVTLDFQPFDGKPCKVLLLKPLQNPV